MNIQRCINTLIANLPGEHAVLSPGSRNASVVYALDNSKFTCHSIIDERSAAFIALGIAKNTRKPVILSCTSGTAALNYYPAIAEAYYARIPLIVLTADRPPEQIDAWDGQAIRQDRVYSNHIRGEFTTPDDYSDATKFEVISQKVKELIANAVPGPIHINIPIREPFYSFTTEGLESKSNAEVTYRSFDVSVESIARYFKTDFSDKKVLIFNGMDEPEDINIASDDYSVVLSDITSNQSDDIHYWDAMLFAAQTKPDGLKTLKCLQPDVLITAGNTTVSKGLKRFLQNYPPQMHYHLSSFSEVGPMFKTNPVVVNPKELKSSKEQEKDINGTRRGEYLGVWLEMTQAFKKRFAELEWSGYNEFSVVNHVLNELPNTAFLHLGNSMPIRYASFLTNSDVNQNIIYCNRGTSGIDGSSSTAVGNALVTEHDVYLLTGDVSFFYDVNAWFNAKLPRNIKVVLLNNGSGGIFNMISGPEQMKDAIKYQTTPHSYTAEHLAKHFGLAYFSASNINSMAIGFDDLKRHGGPAILEVFTDEEKNKSFFDQFKAI